MTAQIILLVATIILTTATDTRVATVGFLVRIKAVHRSEAFVTFFAGVLPIFAVGFHVCYDIVSHAERSLAYIALVFAFVVTFYVSWQTRFIGKGFATDVALGHLTALMITSEMAVQSSRRLELLLTKYTNKWSFSVVTFMFLVFDAGNTEKY